jgi:hypothetical protein
LMSDSSNITPAWRASRRQPSSCCSSLSTWRVRVCV